MESGTNSVGVSKSEASTLNHLIAEFKSTLESQNINLRGQLTFTLSESGTVDVRFHSSQPETVYSSVTGSSTRDKYVITNEHLQEPEPYTMCTGSIFLPQTQNVDSTRQKVQDNYTNLRSHGSNTTSCHAPIHSKVSTTSREFISTSNCSANFASPTSGQFNFEETIQNKTIKDFSCIEESHPLSENVSHKYLSLNSELPDTGSVEAENLDNGRNMSSKATSWSTSALPPFEKIIRQKYSKTISHPSSDHGQMDHSGLNYVSRPDITETKYMSSDFFHTKECDINIQSSKQILPANRNGSVPSNTHELFHKKEVDQVMDGIDGKKNKTPQPCSIDTVESLDNQSNIRDRSSRAAKDKFTQASNTADNKTSEEPEFCSTDSSMKDTMLENLMPPTLRDLKAGNVDIHELEKLTHGELIVMLTKIINDRNNPETLKLSLLSETVSKDGQTQLQRKKHKKSEYEITHIADKKDPKDDSIAKRIGTTRESCRKKAKSVHQQNHNYDHINGGKESTKRKKACNNKVTKEKNNSDKSTSVKLRGVKFACKPNLTQPLKKRNRLRKSSHKDLSSDAIVTLGSEDQSEAQHCDSGWADTEKEKSGPSDEGEIAGIASPSFTCKHCAKVFSNKLVYRRHVRSHATGFQCDICGKTLKTKDSLYHHQRGLHTKDKPYSCNLCSVTFSFHHSYKLHLQRHKGERPHRCKLCHKTYLTSNHLKVHVEAAHAVGSIVCHICGKTFSYNCTLKQHMLKHSGDRPYSCGICEKTFITKQSLRAHTTSHTEIKSYPCEICGKLYKSKHSRNVHMRQHGKQVRRFMCELCGKAFFFKSTLKAHINTHSKARPYSCSLCGKAFKSKASLYTHKYVHRETQPFVCTKCGKAFKTKNCCSAHMKRHENEETFTCCQCGSTFPDKGGLSKHMKTIHVPRKQFTCTICGKKGTRGDNMRTHVKSHRNEKTASNPMDFIIEESISENDVIQGLVQVRPRVRGPRQKNSRRLCSKDNSAEAGGKNNDPCTEIKHSLPKANTSLRHFKSEAPQLSTLHSTVMNLPDFKPQHYNPQEMIMTSETDCHQNISRSSLANLIPDHHHLQVQHQEQHYQQEHSKMPYYLAYMHQQSDVTAIPSSPALSFGPMTGLLSAINPSEHDAPNGNNLSSSVYQNTFTPLQALHSMDSGNQRPGSSLYSDALQMQGSLSSYMKF